VLCASTDGVGTKLKVAIEMKSLKGLGQDLVAMNANDILCLGADPLFFLDYYATGHLDPDEAVQVVQGMTEACRTIGCSVLGGETAEMPSVYQKGDFDLAGFIVGIVNRGGIIDGSRITPGDELIGLASSGPHSNGFSLIRKIIADRKLSLKKTYPPLTRPLGDVLLEPTRLYGPLLESFKNEFALKGIVHQEMERVLNLGIGLVMIVSPADVDPILLKLRGQGEKAWRIGRIASRPSNESALKVHR
ncbi:MAG: phosphoribosylformylglycinamidine cyclo-ligase, partial [Deltaproteobacteria bacterium]|nr:phosphoribosylformylglycinamidine cyclo-ligase [Deltaproteobacteria bacterium]